MKGGVWSRVGIVAAALVAVNLVARLIVRIAGPGDDAEFVIGLWSLGAMVVVLAVAVFLWARRYVVPLVLSYAGVVIVASSILVTVVGPYVSGGSPFQSGFGTYLLQLAICAGILGVATTLGLFTALALGLDPTSRAWKRQAERVKTSPRQRQRGSARR
jgi:hypothetical protein